MTEGGLVASMRGAGLGIEWLRGSNPTQGRSFVEITAPLAFFLLFLLRQAFTDDEALAKLLHFGQSLARSITSLISNPWSFMSSITLSVHFFLSLPLLLVPSISPCSTFAGILPFS